MSTQYVTAALNHGFPPTGEPHYTMHVGTGQHSSVIGVRYDDEVYCFYSEQGYNEEVTFEWHYTDKVGGGLARFVEEVTRRCEAQMIPLR